MTPARSARELLPVTGLLAAALLLVAAAAAYPGGYDWLNQSVSSLFQPRTRYGAPNSARSVAALAVLCFSASVALMFHRISRHGPSRRHQKTVRIAGIGAMVYTSLVVTPMHDVVVTVALLFLVTAIIAILHGLYLERSLGRLGAGIICLALTLFNAVIYYGQVLYGLLPIVQKVSLLLWIAWLLDLSFRASPPARRGDLIT